MKFVLNQDDVKDLSDEQQSSIFDALVAAAWADGNVSQAEMARFEAEVVKVPWGKDEQTLIKMVHGARERVAALKDKDSVLSFIKDIAEKLPSQTVREKVLYMMGVIMFSDRQLSDAEKNVVKAFADAFKITKERFDLIGAEVRGN
jgi:uncharacterized tellurite resistance protein B-like protein